MYIHTHTHTHTHTYIYIVLGRTKQLYALYTQLYALKLFIEHSGDISCSLLVNLSHTAESWAGRNKCLWIYIIYYYYNC